MTIEQFSIQLGFESHPFRFLNADQESYQLSEYFVIPDDFEELWGDPFNPTSNIIYAPRGGGKSAQRIMIEKRAEETIDVLPIAYINFDLSKFKSINDVTIDFHLFSLIQLLLKKFFDRIKDASYEIKESFTYGERQYLFKLAKQYFYNNPSYPSVQIRSFKTFKDKATDFWRVIKSPITGLIKSVSSKQGFEIDLSKNPFINKLESPHKNNLEDIVDYLTKVGYVAIYVLVDKVDEQSLTGNDPSASFTLIKDLLLNLPLIELPNVCYKFFLWDELKENTNIHGRPDRMSISEIKWTKKKLHEMLNKRIATYSKTNALMTIDQILEKNESLEKILLFSEYSPRDCIRICNRIISEQFKNNRDSTILEAKYVDSAIISFSKDKSDEIIRLYKYSDFIPKINTVDFTIEELVALNITHDRQKITNTVEDLLKSSFLLRLDDNPKDSEYAFLDVRLAFDACSNLSLDEFIQKKVYKCHALQCTNIYYRDFDTKKFRCPNCHTENLLDIKSD